MDKKLLKKNTIFILCTFIVFPLKAQNISVTDFHLDEMDLTANQQGTTVLDQNGDKCALIKVKTTQTNFNFDVGSLGVTKTIQKTAEIWVYVPHGIRKMNISHQKYGQLDYPLPVPIQKAKTYIMDLKSETPLPVDHQRLTIKCQPQNAVVMIDGETIDLQEGIAETTLKLGAHKYISTANGYYQTEGSIELKADRPGKLSIDLEPKEGTVVSSTPSSSNATQTTFKETENVISFTVKGVTFEMIKVEGGTFTMGATPEQGKDANSDEKPAHQVTLSSYYIGKYEVTQALWQAVTGRNPSHFKGGDNLPVEWVSWNDCQAFIHELNRKTGKTFRLPTEAEWEYAARGGNKSKGYKYSGSNKIGAVAWNHKNSDHETHEVGTKSPNELGLYDMSGNVWELCQDWYDSNYYKKSPQTNPTGSESGSYRVNRGGCWSSSARDCRSSVRREDSFDPFGFFDVSLGLRLVLSE